MLPLLNEAVFLMPPDTVLDRLLVPAVLLEDAEPLLKELARLLASWTLQLRLAPSKAFRGSSLPHCTQSHTCAGPQWCQPYQLAVLRLV